MTFEIHVHVPDTVVAAAERLLARQGVVKNSRYRQRLSQMLHDWAQRGLLHVAGEANVREHVAAAVDRINARDRREAARPFHCARCAVEVGPDDGVILVGDLFCNPCAARATREDRI